MIIRTVHRVRDRLRDSLAVVSAFRVISRELFRSARRGYRALSADIRRQPRPIRVGVDIRPFYEQLTGVGWYLYEILHEIARMEEVELIAFGDPRMSAAGPSLHGNLPETIEYRIFDMTGEQPSRWTHGLTGIAHPLMMKLERIDLFFGGNYFLPRTMDSVATSRVVTVHDLTYRKRPELLQAETLANLEKHMQRELSRADAVICVSHASRRDLIEEYPIEPARVFAIQNGMRGRPESRMPESRLDLPDRYILFVSTIEPRKNLEVLIDAFEQLRDDGSYEGALVVAGRVGWKSEQTARRLRSSRWSDSIHHLDYVPREHLDEIYRRAELFVLPSHYEGFGFPILEAMSHGVPTITTNVSSLPEVGGDAALYFDPNDVEGLSRAIRAITSDHELRERLIARGRERVAHFDWTRAANQTVEVFRHVMGVEP